jgi:putative ABC transport system substrate-binding protein
VLATRRILLFAGAAVVGLPMPRPAFAAPRRIAWFNSVQPQVATVDVDSVLRRLGGLGHFPGQDFELEITHAERDTNRIGEIARAVVETRPDILVANSSFGVRALMHATSEIPIVMAGVNSPVESGLITSLARPGGNVTGASNNPLEMAGKLAQVLLGASRNIRRLTVVWNPQNPGVGAYRPYAERTAKRLGVQVAYYGIGKPEEFSAEALLRTKPDAIYVAVDPIVRERVAQIIGAARAARLPSAGSTRDFAASGGLLGVGPDSEELEQNVAECIARLLRGAKPADLPVREPARFHVILNMKTAKAIGLAVPQELLLQASEVIE